MADGHRQRARLLQRPCGSGQPLPPQDVKVIPLALQRPRSFSRPACTHLAERAGANIPGGAYGSDDVAESLKESSL